MALQKLTTPNATCLCLTGDVVGLETLTEQRISGHASICGQQALFGYYHGAHANVRAEGVTRGFGYLIGEAQVYTEYSYSTHFFVRDEKGVDRPLIIEGKIPLLENHTVTCIYVKNRYNESALCSIVNHNSRRVYPLITRRDLIKHLDMPTRKRVQRLLLTPAERREDVRRHRASWSSFRPWLYVALLVGLTILGIGLLVSRRRESTGITVALVGLIPSLISIGILIYYYIREWQLRYQPTHEIVDVRNQDLDDELDAIANYIDDVAIAVCH